MKNYRKHKREKRTALIVCIICFIIALALAVVLFLVCTGVM